MGLTVINGAVRRPGGRIDVMSKSALPGETEVAASDPRAVPLMGATPPVGFGWT